MDKIEKVAVIGGGAWGTALACLCLRAGLKTRLWAREAEVVAQINNTHENKTFLPDIALDPALVASDDLSAVAEADALLVVVPAQFLASVLKDLKTQAPLILCSKGIERDTLRLMSQVAEAYCEKAHISVLSGPSFAVDVARDKPTALTLASYDATQGARLTEALSTPHFRLYPTDDVCGAEIGGAVKNVLAIACGIVEGRGLGDSARAALIARGFAEMTRLGVVLGAKPETLAGLCGLGDLILTCGSTTSRNFSLGVRLGEGAKAESVLAERKSVSEGALSATAVCALAQKHNVDMPIVASVEAILDNRISVDEAIDNLLARPVGEH